MANGAVLPDEEDVTGGTSPDTRPGGGLRRDHFVRCLTGGQDKKGKADRNAYDPMTPNDSIRSKRSVVIEMVPEDGLEVGLDHL